MNAKSRNLIFRQATEFLEQIRTPMLAGGVFCSVAASAAPAENAYVSQGTFVSKATACAVELAFQPEWAVARFIRDYQRSTPLEVLDHGMHGASIGFASSSALSSTAIFRAG